MANSSQNLLRFQHYPADEDDLELWPAHPGNWLGFPKDGVNLGTHGDEDDMIEILPRGTGWDVFFNGVPAQANYRHKYTLAQAKAYAQRTYRKFIRGQAEDELDLDYGMQPYHKKRIQWNPSPVAARGAKPHKALITGNRTEGYRVWLYDAKGLTITGSAQRTWSTLTKAREYARSQGVPNIRQRRRNPVAIANQMVPHGARNPQKKRRAPMARKSCNPFAKGKTLSRTEIPKGKRSGDVFTKGGRRYMVISYTTKTGKRVRYARPWKGRPYAR
jgi:hypothetical protein